MGLFNKKIQIKEDDEKEFENKYGKSYLDAIGFYTGVKSNGKVQKIEKVFRGLMGGAKLKTFSMLKTAETLINNKLSKLFNIKYEDVYNRRVKNVEMQCIECIQMKIGVGYQMMLWIQRNYLI